MSFNVQINFTGICTFVPGLPVGPIRSCVILPDAREKHQKALDGSWLKPHVGFVSFPAENLERTDSFSFPTGASLLILLDRHRLTLNPEGGSDEYVQDLEGIPDLDELTGRRGSLDPSVFPLSPSPGVLAQVLINRGRLRAGDRIHRWVLPSTLGGPTPQPIPLSHEVRLILQNLNSFEILAQKFGIPESESWTFLASDDETVVITIGNLCGVVPCYCNEPQSIPESDEDFKWYYQLLRDRITLQSVLHKALPLPIPLPVQEIPAGRGANCIPSVAAPADINTLINSLSA